MLYCAQANTIPLWPLCGAAARTGIAAPGEPFHRGNPMIKTALRAPGSIAVAGAMLLAGGLILARCGTPNPVQPGRPAGVDASPTPARAVPHPLGNANAGGSFGPSLSRVQLPEASPM